MFSFIANVWKKWAPDSYRDSRRGVTAFVLVFSLESHITAC